MFYYTYVLQSERDGNFYTGYTKNLKLRFEQHKEGLVESTSDRRPLRLLMKQKCPGALNADRKTLIFFTCPSANNITGT
jgi:putative endonuclease